MKGVSKRDVKVFLLEVLTMFLIEAIYDWENTVQGFKDGFGIHKNNY